jgi:TolB-like protein
MLQAGSSQPLPLGDCTFDRARGLLLRGGVAVSLRPKAFALLSYLVVNSGRVVDKGELIETLWPGIHVTEDSLTQAVRDVRKALGDDAQALIRNVAKRGYVLSPIVTEDARTDQPSVAVLSFVNEGDAGGDLLVAGFAEDLINGLARFRTVTVLASNSSFTVASDSAVDWRKVGQRLGATYLVRGRMRILPDKLSASVNLIDSASGAALWSDNFAASGEAMFSMQDEIAQKIVNRLVARLDDAGLSRSASKPPASLAAYDLLLKGLVRFRAYGTENNLAAKALFEKALRKDPDYALAHGYLALTGLAIAGYGAAAPDLIATFADRANLAVTLSPEDPRCHRILAMLRLHQRQYDSADLHLKRALELNPSDAHTMAHNGYHLAMRGKPFEALQSLERAVRINPIHPDWYHFDRCIALYSAADYQGALESFGRFSVKTPQRLVRLAACYAQAGNQAEARAAIARATEAVAGFSPLDYARSGVPYEHKADVEHLVEGVTKALAS